MEGEAELDVTQGGHSDGDVGRERRGGGRVLLVGSGWAGAVAGAAGCVTQNTHTESCLEDEFLGGLLDWQWRSPRTQRRAVGDVSDSTIAEVLWQPLLLEYGESGCVFSVAGHIWR